MNSRKGLSRVKLRSGPGPLRLPKVPPGCRIYAVGDIHGRADLLATLHGTIRADSASAPGDRVIVYLGDLIDRGPSSRAVLGQLLDAPLPGFKAVHMMGNHEDALLRFLDGDLGAGMTWVLNGGLETLRSYGVEWAGSADSPGDLGHLLDVAHRAIPRRHLSLLRDMSLSHAEGDYLFVHAGVRPGRSLGQQDRGDLLWIRQEFLECTDDHGMVVVHGHTIVPEIEIRPNRIGIDTGAYFSGRLSCVVLEGEARRLLAT